MVTHSSTSRPVQCLCMAERTGCPVLTDLWSYVTVLQKIYNIKLESIPHDMAERRSPALGLGLRKKMNNTRYGSLCYQSCADRVFHLGLKPLLF
jgi:hypothetical protein